MSEGIVSFFYLSKFEKGESQINFVSFTQLVQRLSMTIDEFLYYNGTRTIKYTDYLKSAQDYTNKSVSELKSHLKKEEE